MVPGSKHAWAENPPMAHGRLGISLFFTQFMWDQQELCGDEVPARGSMMYFMLHW